MTVSSNSICIILYARHYLLDICVCVYVQICIHRFACTCYSYSIHRLCMDIVDGSLIYLLLLDSSYYQSSIQFQPRALDEPP